MVHAYILLAKLSAQCNPKNQLTFKNSLLLVQRHHRRFRDNLPLPPTNNRNKSFSLSCVNLILKLYDHQSLSFICPQFFLFLMAEAPQPTFSPNELLKRFK